MLKTLLAGTTGLLICVGTSTVQGADLSTAKAAVQQKFYEITGKDTAVLTFAKGSSSLSDADAATLKATVGAMRETGPVQEILVIAYSDLPYPHHQKADLPKASRELASHRADAVKKQLDELGASHVTVYDMAKKANWFEKTFKTSDAEVKREAAETPAKANGDDEFYQALGQRLKKEGGAGKVVVVVRHEGSYAH